MSSQKHQQSKKPKKKELPLTYSRPFKGLIPKLLPTTPVHVQVCPAAVDHCAVAVDPKVRHETPALGNVDKGEAAAAKVAEKTMTAASSTENCNMMAVQ